MSRFLSSLASSFAELFVNVRRGLRPGTGPESEALPRKMRRNFWFHIHPVFVTARALQVSATLGLGVFTAVLFLALCASGFLLMIYYVPTTDGALNSVADIQHAVTFGAFVRSLHRFAAHGMVATAFLHLLRVLFTGAYGGRALNWWIGLFLFALTLGLAFTGYLLPWDQLSYWAVSVSSNLLDHVPLGGASLKRMLLGGDAVGQSSLLRFYALHVAILPGLLLGLVALHLWRIRKDGGLARPSCNEAQATIPAWPHLLLREAIACAAVLAVLVALSALVDAPLGGPPDLHAPSNPEKTPWYFLWLQEMVSTSASVGGFWLPAFIALSLALLPFVDRDSRDTSRWFGDRRARWAVLASFALSGAAFAMLEWLFLDPSTAAWLAALSPWARDILSPPFAMWLLALLVYFAAGAWAGSTRAAALASATVIVVAIVGFAICAALRGPGWVFYWPWEEWPHVN